VQKEVERRGFGAESEALNAVIVALSDARHKARQGLAVIGRHDPLLGAMLEEVEAL
jgi:hypothetical protein